MTDALAATVALTSRGREALDAYTQALRDLLGGLVNGGTADYEHRRT